MTNAELIELFMEGAQYKEHGGVVDSAYIMAWALPELKKIRLGNMTHIDFALGLLENGTGPEKHAVMSSLWSACQLAKMRIKNGDPVDDRLISAIVFLAL